MLGVFLLVTCMSCLQGALAAVLRQRVAVRLSCGVAAVQGQRVATCWSGLEEVFAALLRRCVAVRRCVVSLLFGLLPARYSHNIVNLFSPYL